METFFLRELRALARCIHLVDILFKRTAFVACVIEVLTRSISTIICFHLKLALRQLAHQLSSGCIEIQMSEAISFTQHHKLITREVKVSIRSLIHISFIFFSQDKLRCSAARIDSIEVETILMTVQGKHHQLILFARELNTWDVAICFERYLHGARHAAFDVV